MNEWVKKMWLIYAMDYLLRQKKEQSNAIGRNTDRPRGDHTNRGKSGERQVPHEITCMWDLKCDTDRFIPEAETDPQTQRTDLWLPGEEVGWGSGELGCWDWQMQTVR